MTPPVAELEREDLVLFINAASTCSGQSEFYGDAGSERVTLAFLHDYVFGNYRRLYALTLAAGINHYNQLMVIERLLAAGAPDDVTERREENRLITGALRELPPQRVYRLFASLRRARVNNRRTRGVVRAWLGRRDLAFDALKYRGSLRSVSRHTHQALPEEVHSFLVEGAQSRKVWSEPLLDTFRRARFDQRALYDLPFTVAEGLAAGQGIDRKQFLTRIAPKMTQGERARLARHIDQQGATTEAIDFSRMPLTKLATLVLSRPIAEREPLRAPLAGAAQKLARRGLPLPKRVCAVLDRSYSSRAGAQKRNRTLAVTLAISQLLAAAADDYHAFWTGARDHDHGKDELTLRPRGQTNLASPLLAALRLEPDLVVLVTDGFENDPPGAAGEVVRLFREHIDPATETPKTAFVHLSPTFDAESFMPRPLGAAVPTVGIRDASELALKLGFARFAAGHTELDELQSWLLTRADRWLRDAETPAAQGAST